MHCPLCQSSSHFFHQDKTREYHRCSHCKLVFVPKPFHLTADDEKAIYDQHENNPNDLHYLRFLNRLAAPLLHHLNNQNHLPQIGLDFGCGPGPGLATLLSSAGHHLSIYDIFYAPYSERLATTYDFVTCTEVVEHLNDPATTLALLFGLLKSGAILGVMTKRVINQERFANWHYKNDPTHVIFFCEDTFAYLAKQYRCDVIYQEGDVVLFKKH